MLPWPPEDLLRPPEGQKLTFTETGSIDLWPSEVTGGLRRIREGAHGSPKAPGWGAHCSPGTGGTGTRRPFQRSVLNLQVMNSNSKQRSKQLILAAAAQRLETGQPRQNGARPAAVQSGSEEEEEPGSWAKSRKRTRPGQKPSPPQGSHTPLGKERLHLSFCQNSGCISLAGGKQEPSPAPPSAPCKRGPHPTHLVQQILLLQPVLLQVPRTPMLVRQVALVLQQLVRHLVCPALVGLVLVLLQPEADGAALALGWCIRRGGLRDE